MHNVNVIVEQSTEWNSLLYINFMDFENAFDSLHQESLLKLLCHHGVPPKPTRPVKSMYDGMKASVIHVGEVTDSFDINTEE